MSRLKVIVNKHFLSGKNSGNRKAIENLNKINGDYALLDWLQVRNQQGESLRIVVRRDRYESK